MWMINGRRGEWIDAADRGLQYGDGLFETLAVSGGEPEFWDDHMHRLRQGCRRLAIPEPDFGLLRDEAVSLAAQGGARSVLKIIVTRGVGGRGYRPPKPPAPNRILSLHPFPAYPAQWYAKGVTARFCLHRLSDHPALAGLKHLNRLDQVLARAEWEDEDIQEGVMLDQQGYVTEGVMSNIFIVSQDQLYTPELSHCGVAGVMRARVMRLAETAGLVCRECRLTPEAMLQADEAFFTNSIIGVWPLHSLRQRTYPKGPVTELLQQLLALPRV